MEKATLKTRGALDVLDRADYFAKNYQTVRQFGSAKETALANVAIFLNGISPNLVVDIDEGELRVREVE